jgi:hypothetical protein
LAFGIARISYASLAPVVLWYIAIDAVAGIVGPTYLIQKTALTPDVVI